MRTKLTRVGAILLLASMTITGFAQQTRPYWPGAGPTSRTFGVFWDFVRDQEYNSTDFTTTDVGSHSSTVAAEDLLYGTLLFTTAATAGGDGNEVQSKNTCFQLQAGKHTVIATRFITGSDITNNILELGLAGTDTTFIVGHANGVTFRKADGSTTLKLDMVAGGGGTTSDYTTYTVGTLAASTAYECVADVMPLSGDATKAYVKVWFNGALVVNRQVSVDVPSVVLTPSFGELAGATNAAYTFRLDYFGVAQDR